MMQARCLPTIVIFLLEFSYSFYDKKSPPPPQQWRLDNHLYCEAHFLVSLSVITVFPTNFRLNTLYIVHLS